MHIFKIFFFYDHGDYAKKTQFEHKYFEKTLKANKSFHNRMHN